MLYVIIENNWPLLIPSVFHWRVQGPLGKFFHPIQSAAFSVYSRVSIFPPLSTIGTKWARTIRGNPRKLLYLSFEDISACMRKCSPLIYICRGIYVSEGSDGHQGGSCTRGSRKSRVDSKGREKLIKRGVEYKQKWVFVVTGSH